MTQLYKYPRTHHIEGSKKQPGDEDLDSVPFSSIKGKHQVIEEKVDGANCAISFSNTEELLLQSRGHYLTGGKREKHFDLFKSWANAFKKNLWDLLGSRYIMYGEWLYAKHTIFYTDLPHYFLEFDLYDKECNEFLSTTKRRTMLTCCRFIKSVFVLYEGAVNSKKLYTNLLGPSKFINNDHLNKLKKVCEKHSLDHDVIFKQTDTSNLMEGLYIKIEDNGIVKERYKFIRPGFLTNVIESESHWLDRPILPNQLLDSVEIFPGNK